MAGSYNKVLLMGNLTKVELQRSSNSTIWGSQAIGGVLAVTTGSQGDFSGSLEAGSNETIYGAAGWNHSPGWFDLGLQAAHYDSEGFSSAAAGSEPDGFRQTELGGRARFGIVENLAVQVAEDVVTDPAHDLQVAGGKHRRQHTLEQRLAGLAILAGVAGLPLNRQLADSRRRRAG